MKISTITKFRLFISSAWVVALIATLGSLYFSEVRQFAVCNLCWYQRAVMYPQTILLLVAWLLATKQMLPGLKTILIIALVLTTFGWLTALYQNTLIWINQATSTSAISSAICSPTIACTETYFQWLGFITIPFLSLISFTLIIGILLAVIKVLRNHKT